MKLHIVTVGSPKLAYAQAGWETYVKRLGGYHQIRTTHLADKYANDPAAFVSAIGKAYTVAMEVLGKQMTSEKLAAFLEKRSMEGRELSFVIGGPDGLPPEVSSQADLQWSLSELTFPHDLAMVVLAETLYRASTINAGHPYHRA